MTILTKNTDKLREEVAAHVAADSIVQGIYWDAENERGGFIGCLGRIEDPTINEVTYGLPVMLQRIAESIFESLPANEAKAFFAALPDAVGCDGKDLSTVGWQFLAAELRSLPEQSAELQAVIDPVIAGMALLASGQEWTAARAAADAADAAAVRAARAAAWAAADAAWAAADAAWAAADAAWAAARAADAARAATAAGADAAAAARLRQRDLLLRLIAEAPCPGEPPMTTDFRALCAELIASWDADGCDWKPQHQARWEATVNRARAALGEADKPAVPEGREPVAADLEKEFRYWWKETYGSPYFGTVPLVAVLLWTECVLARWGNPAPQPAAVTGRPSDEELLATLKQALDAFSPRHPEAVAMNVDEYSLALELRKARAVLARWGHQPAPPADGEAAELVAWIRGMYWAHPDKERATRAAELLQRLSPPQPVPVSERLPEPSVKVLAHYFNGLGKGRTICAIWVPAKTRSDSYGDDDFTEYDEESDTFYWPEGWYETIENWDDLGYVKVDEGEVIYWQPIPKWPAHALPLPEVGE